MQVIPSYRTVDVIVPKVMESTRVQEEFRKTTQHMAPETLAATYSGKGRTQLYAQPDPYPAQAFAQVADPPTMEFAQEAFAEPMQEELA